MLCSEIIAVSSEIRTEHTNTLCGLNVEFVNVKPGGDRLCGLLVGVSGYIYRGIGFDSRR